MNHRLLSAALVAALAPSSLADFLDGRVVDGNGNGVANVSIGVDNVGSGGDPSLTNAGTDANGFFHVTCSSGGNFVVTFEPPAPPTTSLLPASVGPILVAGTANLGVVVLPDGVEISGRIVNGVGSGVAGVNFDVVQGGSNVDLAGDQTDSLGFFRFAVPTGPIDLLADPSGVVGQTLAPQALELSLAAATDLGTIVMPQGYVVSAIVRNSSNVAVPNCDVDAIAVPSLVQQYTPGDDTNASGFVDFVVAAGTYDFEFRPPFATQLASKTVAGVAVAGNTSLGIVVLPNGVVLSGTIRDTLGAPVPGADVDLALGGVQQPLSGDDANASGFYQVVVPTGTFDVVFTPIGQALGSEVHAGVVISGPTVLDGTLPPAFVELCAGDGTTATACPCGNVGLPGRGCDNSAATGGAHLGAAGATHPDTVVLSADGELASALSIFLQGTAEIPAGAVFGDGVRCAGGSLKRLSVRNAVAGAVAFPQAGDPSITARSAALGDPIANGSTRIYQTYYRDPALGFCPNPPGNSWNVTNAVRIAW